MRLLKMTTRRLMVIIVVAGFVLSIGVELHRRRHLRFASEFAAIESLERTCVANTEATLTRLNTDAAAFRNSRIDQPVLVYKTGMGSVLLQWFMTEREDLLTENVEIIEEWTQPLEKAVAEHRKAAKWAARLRRAHEQAARSLSLPVNPDPPPPKG